MNTLISFVNRLANQSNPMVDWAGKVITYIAPKATAQACAMVYMNCQACKANTTCIPALGCRQACCGLCYMKICGKYCCDSNGCTYLGQYFVCC